MLDELAMIALILLIGSHSLLIKKCFKIEGEIPLHFGEFNLKADVIDSNLQQVRDLLDEALDVIAPMSQPATANPPANMSMGETIASVLLSRLIPPTAMVGGDGTATQQNERAIFEINPTTTNETQDEYSQPSTELPSA